MSAYLALLVLAVACEGTDCPTIDEDPEGYEAPIRKDPYDEICDCVDYSFMKLIKECRKRCHIPDQYPNCVQGTNGQWCESADGWWTKHEDIERR